MSDKPKEYFIIISAHRGPSTYPHRHDTAAKAVAEASRLARDWPEQKFFVYKSYCAVQAPSVIVTPQSPDCPTPFDDEIPF